MLFQSTLPREERLFQSFFQHLQFKFQSTLPREERRCPNAVYHVLYAYFNPRSHERSDPHAPCLSFACRYFNPRSHERSDVTILSACIPLFISIHAPTRGATRSAGCVSCTMNISIHAPTRGATNKQCQIQQIQLFQSTLPREERRRVCVDMRRLLYFNPRSHERSDQIVCVVFVFISISIHAPTRGATPSAAPPFLLTNYFNPRSHERSDGVSTK